MVQSSQSLLQINDLGQYVTVSVEDADADAASTALTGLIAISVENDIPTLTLGEDALTGTVQEDALGNENNDPAADDTDGSIGNEDAPGVDTDTATIQLSSLVSSSTGADEPAPVVYSLADLADEETDYTSNGLAVTYSTSGNVLTASTTAGTVFTFTVDANTGEAVFNLEDQLDHSGAGDDDELLQLKLDEAVLAEMPALTLARIDGKSPVEYLTDETDKGFVRRAARTLIKDALPRLASVRNRWQYELEHR